MTVYELEAGGETGLATLGQVVCGGEVVCRGDGTRVALLIGNEGAGLPEEIIRSADARVHIPMGTRVESLNAAAAAAVLFYEAFRQRFPRPG